MAVSDAGWLTPFEGDAIAWHESLPSPYTYKEADFGALVSAVHAYESKALALRDLCLPVVERYGAYWRKDSDYYAAAEALGIEES